jgi:protein TonB
VILKSERSKGLLASVFLHASIFGLGGAVLARPIQYAVEAGSGGIEVNLVAAPAEAPAVVIAPVHAEAPPLETAEEKTETVRVPEPSPEPQVRPLAAPSEFKGDGSSPVPGRDETTYRSAGGAITKAQPNYLKNPAPVYPRLAREKGWEGLVVLRITVDPSGRPVEVEKESGSGYEILDESAIKTVKTWRFLPARLGGLAVRSTVRVPVRFELDSDR